MTPLFYRFCIRNTSSGESRLVQHIFVLANEKQEIKKAANAINYVRDSTP